jgi:hypothetical protein
VNDYVSVLLALNALLSGGALVYLIKVEHRFTALETQMKTVLYRLRLAEE